MIQGKMMEILDSPHDLSATGTGGTQELLDDRGLKGEEGRWRSIGYNRSTGHIFVWGHEDSHPTGCRLDVSDLRDYRMLGACSELGICEGDRGKMRSQDVGERRWQGILRGSVGSKWPWGVSGRLTTHLELKAVPGTHSCVSGH